MAIDRKIITLSGGGEISVVTPRAVDYDSEKYSYEEVQEWCKQNCKGPFYITYRWRVTFHDDEDAMLFKLRWL